MTLLDFANLLASALGTDEVYTGNIDGNAQSCIGVYNAKGGIHQVALGGSACTKTKEKHITLLIHHTDNPTLCEQRAAQVLSALTGISSGGVKYIRPDEPQSVGRDERGVCEYVINAVIYYEEE